MFHKDIRQGMVLLLLISAIITLFLANWFGQPVQTYETNLYQRITNKKKQHILYDSAGIPQVFYEGNLGLQYNIVTIAEEALRQSIEKDSLSEMYFFTCLNWLIRNGKQLNDSSIIFYNYYDWSNNGIKSPWRSAMNQGRVMQCFLKGYEKTGDSLYLEFSKKSMNSLYTEVKNGGVTYIDKNGYWFEEYADDNVPQSRVLNGMIVVLQALSDYYKITKDISALFLFKMGVNAVTKTLHQYDNNGHSNYDVLGRPANPWYHKFHIELLDFLYAETNDQIFNEYKQKWLHYKEATYLAALIKKPTRIGVFTVFTLFVTSFSVVFGISLLLRKFKRLKELKS